MIILNSYHHVLFLVAPVILMRPTDVTVDEGRDAVFMCGVRGKPSPTIVWHVEGNHTILLPGETLLRYSTTATSEGQVLLRIKVRTSLKKFIFAINLYLRFCNKCVV